MSVGLDPFSPAFRADPYPLLAALREADPIHFAEERGTWFLSRYADVLTVLRDEERFSSRRLFVDRIAEALPPGESRTFLDVIRKTMLASDPPDHTRLRNLVNKAFSPRVVDGHRPRVIAITNELLDQAAGAGRIDVIADLAVPLPLYVIGELLGVSRDDRPLLKRWSDDLAILVDRTMAFERLAPAAQSAREIEVYMSDVIAARRREPRADLISELVAAQEQGDVLSDRELYTTCVLLLVAGHETTMGLIGNGMLALLRHPDVAARLRNDPALMRPAIEELLRYDSPVQLVARTARTDVVLDGRAIAAGQDVVALIGAANRDPARFADPDRLDIERPDNRHLAFGHGIHFCLGAHLTAQEARSALGKLIPHLDRFDLELHALERNPYMLLHGVRSIPLTVKA